MADQSIVSSIDVKGWDGHPGEAVPETPVTLRLVQVDVPEGCEERHSGTRAPPYVQGVVDRGVVPLRIDAAGIGEQSAHLRQDPAARQPAGYDPELGTQSLDQRKRGPMRERGCGT